METQEDNSSGILDRNAVQAIALAATAFMLVVNAGVAMWLDMELEEVVRISLMIGGTGALASLSKQLVWSKETRDLELAQQHQASAAAGQESVLKRFEVEGENWEAGIDAAQEVDIDWNP